MCFFPNPVRCRTVRTLWVAIIETNHSFSYIHDLDAVNQNLWLDIARGLGALCARYVSEPCRMVVIWWLILLITKRLSPIFAFKLWFIAHDIRCKFVDNPSSDEIFNVHTTFELKINIIGGYVRDMLKSMSLNVI